MLNTEGEIPVAVYPNSPVVEKVTKWTKSYSKTSTELINVMVEGTAENSLEQVVVTVKNDEIVHEIKITSGTKIKLKLGF